MRRILFFLILALAATAFAVSSADRLIVLDGDSTDFGEDEKLFRPGEELAFDSRWGENNDISQIRATWNADTLYVAVDGRCWNNNIILFLDTDPTGGIPDLERMTTGWKRKLQFLNREPDLFMATWDGNTQPQLWRVRPGAQMAADQLQIGQHFRAHASYSQGQPGASMEGAIPWTELFPGGDGFLPPDLEIGLVAVVVASADGLSGPDAAPNNSFQMPENSGDIAYVDNFLLLRPDRNNDGLADMNVEPGSKDGDHISDTAALSVLIPYDEVSEALEILSSRASIDAFSPNGDGELDRAHLEIEVSRSTLLKADVYDGRGRRLDILEITEEELEDRVRYHLHWDGRDRMGRFADPGIYFARDEVIGAERVLLPMAVLR